MVLHLNPSKSEAIAFFNPRFKPLTTLAKFIQSIFVAGSLIKLQSSIKSQGVHLDSKMSFDEHVFEVCRASYFHIRALRHIRSSLTTDAAKTLASSIVLLSTSPTTVSQCQYRPLDSPWFSPVQERLLIVPRTRTNTIGPHGFFHTSPVVWNSLLDDLRDPELSIGCFRNKLKTFIFSQI